MSNAYTYGDTRARTLPKPTKTMWRWVPPASPSGPHHPKAPSHPRLEPTSASDPTSVDARTTPATAQSHSRVSYSSVERGDAIVFADFARQWKEETLYFSSIDKIVNHPSYKAIIAMGIKAIPHILIDLQSSPDHWFHALSVITGEDPVPDYAYGDIELMAEAWLEWGKSNSYI